MADWAAPIRTAERREYDRSRQPEVEAAWAAAAPRDDSAIYFIDTPEGSSYECAYHAKLSGLICHAHGLILGSPETCDGPHCSGCDAPLPYDGSSCTACYARETARATRSDN